MSNKKTLDNITPTQIKAKGVVSLADRPNQSSSYGVGGLSATNLKLWFDKLATFLADKINEIQNVLNGDGTGEDGVYGSDYIGIPQLGEDITCLTDLVNAITSGELATLLMAYASESEADLSDVQSIINGFAKQIADLEETVGLIYYGAYSTADTLKVGYTASSKMTDLSMNEAVKAGYYFLLFWTDTSTNIDYLCACLATAVADSTVTWQVVSYVRLTGATGNGIKEILKTKTSGLVDTYTIYYTDGTTAEYKVTNGKDGEYGKTTADEIVFTKNVTRAGNYDNVGNIENDGTELELEGKTLQEVFEEIFCNELQPTITQPSATVTLANSSCEVGTSVTPSYVVSFNNGSYTYDDDTGVKVTGYSVTDTNGATSTEESGTLTSFTMEDNTSYYITAKVSYSAGNEAKTNLGNGSGLSIEAGLVTKTSKTLTGYRSMFVYIGEDNSSTITSSWVRFNATDKKSSRTPGTLTIPDGTTRVMIAVPASEGYSLSSVIDNGGMGLDVVEKFTQSTVSIEGANGYTAVSYTVWTFEYSAGLAATTYTVTLSK